MLGKNSVSGGWPHHGGFKLLRNLFFERENKVLSLVMFLIVFFELKSAFIAQGLSSSYICCLNSFLSLLLLPHVPGNTSELNHGIFKLLIGGILVVAYRFG